MAEIFVEIRRLYKNNLRHCDHGPAIVWPDGRREWFIMGVDITRQVESWMVESEISWPWDRDTQVEFFLTFA